MDRNSERQVNGHSRAQHQAGAEPAREPQAHRMDDGAGGSYGYAGGGPVEPGEQTFRELGVSRDAQERAHQSQPAERIEYTHNPFLSKADRERIARLQEARSNGEKGAYSEERRTFSLKRDVAGLCLFGAAILAAGGVLLAILFQFLLAVPALALAALLFFVGRHLTRRSAEESAVHSAQAHK